MREHEEALRSAGGAGKSGETPSVEASAQIDSKVDQKKLCPCLSSNVSSHFYMYVEQWLFFMPSLLPVPPHFPLFSSLLRLHVPSSSSSPSFPSFPCPCLSPPLLSISSPFLFLPHLLSSLLSYSPPTQHHSAEVLKWEESKRWQKRLEGLRTKLTEKNRELEAAQRQIKALKETLARCVSQVCTFETFTPALVHCSI